MITTATGDRTGMAGGMVAGVAIGNLYRLNRLFFHVLLRHGLPDRAGIC